MEQTIINKIKFIDSLLSDPLLGTSFSNHIQGATGLDVSGNFASA